LGVASRALAEAGHTAPQFACANNPWQHTYDKALRILDSNVQVMPHIAEPVLIEGSDYAGIWMECGPHESLVYRHFRPDVARSSHTTFFKLQREDGQLPANNRLTGAGFGQIQMVVPIAGTAWELAAALGDSEFLATAYQACARWDAWLLRYRNTRGTGLIEGFCTYDTGMDNCPRWAGFADECPDADARRCPPHAGLPRLCPDLSATVFGARMALAAMAAALGHQDEADRWRESAEALRKAMMQKLYAAEDAAFYDLDAGGRWVKVRTDVMTRVASEHMVDQRTFDAMWQRQLGNPRAFWAPFPFPSVAMDDPAFVRSIPSNSWGGAAQALTALRAGRWMDHYGRSAEFAHLMEQWCAALQRDTSFRQQLNPVTGELTQGDLPNYSPACLVFYDFTWRLAGVCEEREQLHWNVRPQCAAAEGAQFTLPLKGAMARMSYQGHAAKLDLNGRTLADVEGTARLVTDKAGTPLALVGVSAHTEPVEMRLHGIAPRKVSIEPNQSITLG
jgi:hypothetical protein